jgi:intein/homing endonuclease
MGRTKIPDWLDKAWLNLGDVNQIDVPNPLAGRSILEIENPGLAEVRLMSNPSYLHYAAKVLLNTTLLPIQAVILEELWKRPFPMFIASRGFGKCVKNCYIQTSRGICKIDDLFSEDDPYDTKIPFTDEILGENGFHKPSYRWKTKKNTYKLTTVQGYEIIGSDEHPIKIVRDGKFIWEKLSNLKNGNRIIIDLNHYDKWGEFHNDLRTDDAYLLGYLAASPNAIQETYFAIEHKSPKITQICKRIASRIFGKPQHHIIYSNFQWFDKDKILELQTKYDFGPIKLEDRIVPKCVLGAKKDTIAAFLRGCFDSNGQFQQTKNYAYLKLSAKSLELLRTIQILLLKFKIIAQISKGLNNNTYKIAIINKNLKIYNKNIGGSHISKKEPLVYSSKEHIKTTKTNIPIKLIKEKLLAICKLFYAKHVFSGHQHRQLTNKYRMGKGKFTYDYLIKVMEVFSKSEECRSMQEYKDIVGILNTNYYYDTVSSIENLGEQTLYDVYFDEPDHSYITNGFISHNSFLMAVYALLRCALVNNTKFVVCGAGFRQSKIIHDYMCTIWNNAPILRSICSTTSGPKFSIDRCIFIVNNSVCSCIPIGDGQKIRGMRATNILCDEFDSINPDIYETVIQGFASVSSDPVGNVMLLAKKREMEKLGLWNEEFADQYLSKKSNQAVISGTAGYSFRNFYKYFIKYKKMIEANNDIEKLKELFSGEEIPKSFNSSDYSIIRIPYELIPDGFMDEKTIIRAKSTMHSGIYKMEFSACADGDTPIITKSGVKKIKDIIVGEYVFTHKGRFRKVLETLKRKYNGNIIKYKTFGYNQYNLFTPEHPFYHNGQFTPISEIEDKTYLANVQELSGKMEINLEDFCTNYISREGYIYPRASSNKLSNENVQNILRLLCSGKNAATISREIGIPYTSIAPIKYFKRTKSSLNKIIKLDYKFGLCLGYYASEGSIRSKGLATGFALDSHVGVKFSKYIDELSNAIHYSFGIAPKIYKYGSTCVLSLNSRIAAELFKSICPGICYNKLISHDILFSNSELMKGFIVGIFNGDGHIRKGLATLGLTNLDLITQTKLVLSYFGISSSISKIERGNLVGRISNGKINGRATVYKLNLFGRNYCKFLNIFYNGNIIVEDVYKRHIQNDNNYSIYKLDKKDSIPYDDYVYNLEVEEDHSYSTLNASVHNCFARDSDGFFRRALIESCVGTPEHPIQLPSGNVWFDAALHGDPFKEYVMGIDPAAAPDNFSIVIIELNDDHNRVVYCWTTNRPEFQKRLTAGLAKEHDYYGFCARKIRELMGVFNCKYVAMDSQGGGIAVEEALHDKDKLKEGELPIWRVIDDKHPNNYDNMPGLHILHLCNFVNGDWTAMANNGLKKDFEDKALLFPRYDSVTLGLAAEEDSLKAKIIKKGLESKARSDGAEQHNMFDTLEDCVIELEELKTELSTIVLTSTNMGRDRWDTPTVKLPNGKRGKLRKDRYSALVMANMIARQYRRALPPIEYQTMGGFAHNIVNDVVNTHDTPMYSGPEWITSWYDQVYGR